MKVYQTDGQGYFVGAVTADPDPLEPAKWLIPAGCVIASPPDAIKGSRLKWDGSQWVNEPIPTETVPKEPDPVPQDISIRYERDRLLAESDWIVTKAVEQNAQDGLGIQVPQVWLDYRQALRDIPQQPGFPDNVTWPTAP